MFEIGGRCYMSIEPLIGGLRRLIFVYSIEFLHY